FLHVAGKLATLRGKAFCASQGGLRRFVGGISARRREVCDASWEGFLRVAGKLATLRGKDFCTS
ncbi:MAG: hypothetical protein IJ684_04435, partial [Bacteroidales bacterium]|nr:hypothetical protein [Bacteroidales bacterium]